VVAVLTALAECGGAVPDAECRAGEALQTMTDDEGGRCSVPWTSVRSRTRPAGCLMKRLEQEFRTISREPLRHAGNALGAICEPVSGLTLCVACL
jgi:hypothetical protein